MEESYLIYKNEASNLETNGCGLVERHLKYVERIAKRYCFKKISFMDLIQEGNIGLLKAAEKFDEKYGVKFTTYAYRWIKIYILRYLKKNLEYRDNIEKEFDEHRIEDIFNIRNEINEVEVKCDIENAIENLEEKERKIIIMRYGIDYESSRTLLIVADELGIPIDSIWRAEKKALLKLREFIG